MARWAASCRPARPRSASSTASSPGWERATRSSAGSPRSWSRCRRPPTSCATPPPAASSSSTRSGGEPPLRRPLDRVGGGRAHRPVRGRPEDHLRHPLPRARGPRRGPPSVGNLHVSAREWRDTVVFLRKIEPGGSDRSFGIQVARLAGLPAPVVVRAQEIPRQPRADRVRPGRRPRLPTRSRARRRGPGSSRSSPARTRRSSTSCGGPTRTSSLPSRPSPPRRAAQSGSPPELG